LLKKDAGTESGAAKDADKIQSEPEESEKFAHNQAADKVIGKTIKK
jgi:hypothetical protein